jgi:hypothetical protein
MLQKFVVAVILLWIGWLGLLTKARAGEPPDFVALIDAEDVMAHVRALSVAIGARPMGSDAEARAAAYIAAALTDWGYSVEIQEFQTTASASAALTSRNVIATRAGDDQIVIVGAHMDSVAVGTGAGDNASGVGAMLTAAEALKDVETTHTLIFVAFGAEEGGQPSGARAYVDRLGADIAHVTAMINIDSVGVGTRLNVYAGGIVTWPEAQNDTSKVAPQVTGAVWVRDLALDLAVQMNLPFGTTPPDTWNGYTGSWSDHYAFALAGVPVAYFEAWQWEGAKDPWWGQETAEGDVMNTAKDVYEAVVPEKVEMAAELVATTTYALATGTE